jgi:hypothetical protein
MDLAFSLDQSLYVGVAGGLVRIGSSVTAVDPALRPRPTLQASPNPFTTRVAIRFTTPSVAVVRLDVFDLLGRRVAKLAQGPYGPGTHEVTWMADGQSGESIPPGMYWIRLRLGSDPPLVRSVLRRR